MNISEVRARMHSINVALSHKESHELKGKLNYAIVKNQSAFETVVKAFNKSIQLTKENIDLWKKTWPELGENPGFEDLKEKLATVADKPEFDSLRAQVDKFFEELETDYTDIKIHKIDATTAEETPLVVITQLSWMVD